MNKDTRRYDWAYIAWPLNGGSARDIPDGALLHDSLRKRLTSKKHSNYRPSNNRGDDSPPCLVPDKFVLKQEDKGVTKKSTNDLAEPSGIHNIYTLKA
jgi:hypothetical protein